MKKVIITGGLGYIGSHIAYIFSKRHYQVHIIDNFSNSDISTLHKIQECLEKEDCRVQIIFHKCDLISKEQTATVLHEICNTTDEITIVHCASKKSVKESIDQPLIYYNDNLSMTINLLSMLELHENIKHFVFSSSATVYGLSTTTILLNEFSDTGKNMTNPYGKSKFFQEEIIKDFSKTHQTTQFYLLRYFNPVGCHESGLIGEDPLGTPSNLMPFIMRVAANHNKLAWTDKGYDHLTIYGNDYDTHDGTCVRDFIHVLDLAKAHIDVLNVNNDDKNLHVYNVGTGKGISVMEIVNWFTKVTNVQIPYIISTRREGDCPHVVCNADKIVNETNWRPEETIETIVKSCWKYMTVKYNF